METILILIHHIQCVFYKINEQKQLVINSLFFKHSVFLKY